VLPAADSVHCCTLVPHPPWGVYTSSFICQHFQGQHLHLPQAATNLLQDVYFIICQNFDCMKQQSDIVLYPP